MSSLLPRDGQTIIFSVVPPMSYATPGIRYRVSRGPKDRDFHLTNVATGSSTYERPAAMAASSWAEAA